MASLANARLRKLRGLAHSSFDPIWRDSTRTTRDEVYAAGSLVMKCDDLHIGFLDESECLLLIERIDEVGAMVDTLVLARSSPDLNLSEACIEVLLSAFMPTGQAQPKDLVPRSAIDPYTSLKREALLKGAIYPDPAQMYRLSQGARELLVYTSTLG